MGKKKTLSSENNMASKTQMGLVRITYELLEDLLTLDATHKIVDIYAEPEDRQKNQLRVKVVGPKMPHHVEGFEPVIIPFTDIKEGIIKWQK